MRGRPTAHVPRWAHFQYLRDDPSNICTHTSVIVASAERGNPRVPVLLQREPPDVRVVRDIECSQAVGQHEVVQILDRVLQRTIVD